MELIKKMPMINIENRGHVKIEKRTVFFILAVMAVAVLFHYLSGESFLTPRNLSNLSRQVCVNLTLAVGMTLIILTSGIDLSVGSVLALSAMTSAITQVHLNFAQWGWLGAMLSVLSALSVGSFCGGMTGLFVSRLNVTPFIVTLGMMVIGRGLTLIISGAQAVAPLGPELGRLSSDYLPVSLSWGLFTVLIVGTTAYFIKNVFSYGENVFKAAKEVAGILFLSFLGVYVFCGYQGIPYMVIVAFICAILGVLTLKYLRFGRFLYAIGGNREAAELSGVPVKKTLLTVYFIMGLLAGLAGLLDSARVNGAVPSAGELTELDAIAAVVIGGTSLMGGAGTITGTVFGVLVLGMLNNGMSLMGMSEHYQKVFKGVVIILAVLLDMRSKKK